MKRALHSRPELCPHCGAEVPDGASACPGCGSDEQTGWSEQARYDALDLPGEGFDYGEFVAREFGSLPAGSRRGGWIWWVALGLMLAALFGVVF